MKIIISPAKVMKYKQSNIDKSDYFTRYAPPIHSLSTTL